ncbi:MAG: HAD-IA family hydrolase [Planctomycetota bacterium]|nr:HAD-IA family hydrolase [Planctomycetota bacterium]
MRYPTVLFDLDGTLLDSVGGIASAVNLARESFGLRALPLDLVRTFVGDGVDRLIERSFEDAGLCAEARARYLSFYSQGMYDGTRVYPGVAEALAELEAAGCRMGVVTNKPGGSARKLLEHFGLARFLGAILGGDNPHGLKPNPAPLLAAVRELNGEPARALMVGDGPADVAGARGAGLAVCIVSYGIGDPAELRALNPDHEVASFADVPAIARGA